MKKNIGLLAITILILLSGARSIHAVESSGLNNHIYLPIASRTWDSTSASTCTVSADSSGEYTTINAAVANSNCGVINLAAGIYTETVTVDRPLTLVGAGADVTFIDGNKQTTVITVTDSAVVSMSDLTIQHGRANFGGGIVNDGVLTISNSTVISNTSFGDKYGIGYGGGVINRGTLTVIDSTIISNTTPYGGGGISAARGKTFLANTVVKGNTSARYGGGIYIVSGEAYITDNSKVVGNIAVYNNGQSFGGGIANEGALTVTDSTIMGNEAWISGGGIYANLGTLYLSGSIISGNSAHSGGGVEILGPVIISNTAIVSNTATVWGGGGIHIWWNGNLILNNSTVSGNTASTLGGGGISNETILNIINTTITNNTAMSGGGGGTGNRGILTMENTIVANNLTGGDCANAGSFISLGHNLSSDLTCSEFTATGDITNTNPLLGPLQDNGGNTLTMALLSGSPAIDAGYNNACPETDQRGVFRPLDGNQDGQETCDIGAYEVICNQSIAAAWHSAEPDNIARFDLSYNGQINVEDIMLGVAGYGQVCQ